MGDYSTGQNNGQPMSFEDFERDWKRKHKSAIPRRAAVSSMREFFWIGFWMLVATGAAIFSAAHTIPAAELTIFKTIPQRGYLAITAFVIVELVIFGAAAGRREIGWLKYLMAASLLVALAGNNSSSIRAVAENGGDWLNQGGGILLSVIAPITALAAGEVLHIQLDKRNAKQRIAQADYDAAQKETEAKINQAYTRHLKDFEREKAVNLPPVSTLPTSKQPTRAVIETADFLLRHPEFDNLSSRDVAPLVGVSHTIVNDARKHIKRSVNGHTHQDGSGE